MSTIIGRAVMPMTAVAMIVIALLTLFAPVIAPTCTGIPQLAGVYQLSSIAIFLGAYLLFTGRRRSIVAALLLPVSWALLDGVFAAYLNTLPITCT